MILTPISIRMVLVLLASVRTVRTMAAMRVRGLPVSRLTLRAFFLICRVNPKIMFGMLIIIFCGNSVAGTGSIPRER